MVLSALLVLLMVNMTSAANTPTPVFNKKMETGIGNVIVYIDGNLTPRATYWQRLLTNAVHNWMYTECGANPFYATYVSSNNGSNIDIYARYNSYFNAPVGAVVLAQTTFYSRAIVQVNPNNSDWFSATIDINHTELSKSQYSNDEAKGTFAHEIGHALGLAHNNTNPNSIMCQTAAGRLVQTVQEVDNNALNSKY